MAGAHPGAEVYVVSTMDKMGNVRGARSQGRAAGGTGQTTAPEPPLRDGGGPTGWFVHPQPANPSRKVSRHREWSNRLWHCAAHRPITERG